MLTILMMYMLNFTYTPTFTQTVPGDYYEVVRMDYDVSSNQTYAVWGRYYIEPSGAGRVYHMQAKPYPGQPTKEDILKTALADSHIKVVDLVK